VLLLVPFLDRGASGLPPNAFSRVGGAAVVALGLVMAALGTWSMHVLGHPLGVAGGLAAAAVDRGLGAPRPARPAAGGPSLLFPALGWLAVAFIVVMTVIGRIS
jgi:hypothetical protein